MSKNSRDKKRQHWVPREYLAPWCDQSAQTRHPFLWRVGKNGEDAKAKSPKNIFKESDIYTFRDENGNRDLSLEEMLGRLEQDFVRVRREKIIPGRPLTPKDRVIIQYYAAAQLTRTPKFREHHRSQWAGALKMMDELAEKMKTATDEQKKAAGSITGLSGKDTGLSHEQVREIVLSPVQHLMPGLFKATGDILVRMSLTIFKTDDPIGFVTSDAPCVMFDPEWHKLPPLYRAPALGSPTIEVTLPISPGRLAVIHHHNTISEYVDVPAGHRTIDELNRRTIFHCAEHFVVNRKETKPIWFEYPEPDGNSAK